MKDLSKLLNSSISRRNLVAASGLSTLGLFATAPRAQAVNAISSTSSTLNNDPELRFPRTHCNRAETP